METEKKKLLLVAISVGVFLVISIAAAIFIVQQGSASAEALSAIPAQRVQPSVTFDPLPSYQLPPSGISALDAIDLVRSPSDLPGLRPAPEGIVNRDSDYHVRGSDTVINVPKPSTVAVPDTPPAGRAAPRPSTPRPAVQPTAVAPRPAAQPTAAAPRPAAQPTAAAPRPAPAAQTRVYDDYWVQTGAFSTVAKAEGVKETLASKGITSMIENRIINGQAIFRVRVGPYTSQNEANYWLSLIKSINGFEESQIRQTQSRR